MRRLIWESSWQGIQFHELGVKLNCFGRPSAEFYSRFYNAIFSKYDSFEALPPPWKKIKSKTALEISKLINDEATVLSIGSGLGYLDKEIIKYRPELKINTYDFADNASNWSRTVSGINPVPSLDIGIKYQFIFCSQLFYALSNKELENLSRVIKTLLSEGGVFLTVDTSLNPDENGKKEKRNNSIKAMLKNLIRPLFFSVFARNYFQFWGWQRDNSEILKIFDKNGFIVEKAFPAVGQSFLLFRLADI